MSEMKERIGKIIFNNLPQGHTLMTWKNAPERKWIMPLVDKILTAMREPTDEMIDAAWYDTKTNPNKKTLYIAFVGSIRAIITSKQISKRIGG